MNRTFDLSFRLSSTYDSYQSRRSYDHVESCGTYA